MDEASEERPTNSDEWGIVSVSISGSQVHVDEERSGRSSHLNSGVLIVDGVDSTLSGGRHHRDNENSNFPIPGTDSLPTDPVIEDTRGRMRALGKLPILMILVPMVCCAAMLAGLGYLVKERNMWRSSALRLEEEIHHLELEAERIKNTYEAYWDQQGQPDKTSNLLTLVLDNRWLQAKADIKLGARGFEKKDKIKELSESFKGKWEDMWNAASNIITDSGNEGDSDKSDTLHRERSYRRFDEAFASASGSLSSKMAELLAESKRLIGEVGNTSMSVRDEAVDGLSTATMGLNEAMAAASNALSFEIQELSKNPSTYLADVARDAMKEASCIAKSGRASMQGLFAAAPTVASSAASLACWSETASDAASEAVSVEVTESTDDPLYSFEFQSTKNGD